MTGTKSRNTSMQAGVGKVDITCRAKGTWEDLLCDKVKKHIPPAYLCKKLEISDPLYARVLVLDDGREPLVLVTMDVTAIGARTISQNILSDSADDFMPRLRKRIETEFDIPGRNVNVCASHSHQVPRMLCDDEDQITRTLEAIRQARQNMVPVTVGIGASREDGLTFNRTMMMKDGSDYTVRSYHSTMPLDEQIERLRPIDPQIGVLRVDRLNGRPLAVIYNFASHLSLGAPGGIMGTITADHVGVTLRYLEENIGGDAMAFFLQGAVGDAYEACVFDTDHPYNAQDFGCKLGQSVLKAYATIQTGPTKLGVVSRNIELSLRTDIPEVIAGLKREQAEMLAALRYTTLNFKAFLPLYLKYSLNPNHPSHWSYRYMHADDSRDVGLRTMDDRNKAAIEKYLDSIKKMERMADHEERIATLEKHQEVIEELGMATVPAEFQGIRIGDCVFITAPMEILSEVGLRIKKTSPFKQTYVVSLSNGYLHYAPPAAYYPRGGYEVTECLLAPEWEKVFESIVQEIFDELQAKDGTT